MIRTFSTLFAGHVDFEDMGQFATPVNERRYSNEHLVTVFDKTQAIFQRTAVPVGALVRPR